MLIYILAAVVVVIVAILIVAAMQPSDFVVERSGFVSAPPPVVFAQVNDFHNWEEWSPWAKLDPHSKVKFQGPPSGAGAIFTWSGNKKVGEGRMTITESHPSDRIEIKLEFEKPFKATNKTEFTFTLQGNQTAVKWKMSGRHTNIVGKAFCMFMNMDKMVGGDFEKGLAQMKSVAETACQK